MTGDQRKEPDTDKLWKEAYAKYKNEEYESAYEKFSILSRMGCVEAYVYIGWMIEFGLVQNEDPQNNAEENYQIAANNGSNQGKYYLSLLYLKNRKNDAALKYLIELHDIGYRDANWNAGKAFYRIGDYENAFKYYKESAESNDMRGLYWLGMMYLRGWGVGRDKDKAVKFLKSAADMGHVKAEIEYSKRLLFGYKGITGFVSSLILIPRALLKLSKLLDQDPSDIRVRW